MERRAPVGGAAADLIGRLLAREGLGDDPEAADRVRGLLDGWLGSSLLAEFAEVPVQAELPFVVGLGETVVRGQIDLLVPAADDGVPTVIDYKTDALRGRPPAELAERYRAQREVYAIAAGSEHGARVAHVFLEAPDDPVIATLDGPELTAARDRLERMIAAMHEGRFEVAPEPYAELCLGCPAAARLCPRPAWRPRS